MTYRLFSPSHVIITIMEEIKLMIVNFWRNNIKKLSTNNKNDIFHRP